MTVRKINDKNADMDRHAALPPKHEAGGHSKREDLCQPDSERVVKTTPGALSSGQLEMAGPSSSGRLVATEDASITGETKVHLQSITHGEKYIRTFA